MNFPDNGSYMVAAYIVTAVVLVAYSMSLFVRVHREARDVDE